uniref:Uncharacterized protein n=1 Tax=Rhodosorus marinus TaxID=101924 RepID=A0A7S0BD61_9RHOD|mmetsp:Transcript_1032/g.1657  ORF Transcript_1032/g.1657 Transcript_1032/m.1657 type:complete len:365 (+) Transcript_1032:483-1577(+)
MSARLLPPSNAIGNGDGENGSSFAKLFKRASEFNRRYVYKEAATLFLLAYKEASTSSEQCRALDGAGFALMELGQEESAVSCLKEAEQLLPKTNASRSTALSTLCQSAEESFKYKEDSAELLRGELSRAMGKKPRDVLVVFGLLMQSISAHCAAASFLMSGLEDKDPVKGRDNLQLAKFYVEEAREGARDIQSIVNEVEPKRSDLEPVARDMGVEPELCKARLSILENNVGEARRLMQASSIFIEQATLDVDVRLMAGRLFEKVGLRTEAVKTLNAVTAEWGGYAEAWYYLAELYLKMDDLRKARESVEKLLKCGPGAPKEDSQAIVSLRNKIQDRMDLLQSDVSIDEEECHGRKLTFGIENQS